MRSFFSSLSMSFVCAASALAAVSSYAQPVQSLIIKLRPVAQTASAPSSNTKNAERDSAKASTENRERMRALGASSGVHVKAHRALGLDHQVMLLASPMQGQALEDTMRRLRLDPEVESVEPNVRMRRLDTTPNDPQFAQQWHLGNVRPGFESALNLPRAWDRTTGAGEVVAVLDTGILPHPDLVGKVLPGYDFVTNEIVGNVSSSNDGDGRDSDPSDPGDWVTAEDQKAFGATNCQVQAVSSWHGTFIAGQIAAAANNSVGVAGVNWNARILPVRVSGKCGALLSDTLDSMRWAAGLRVEGVPDNRFPARIINLSFGGDKACSSSYQSVIDEITAAGSLLVVAAGNRGKVAEINTDGSVDTASIQLKRPADCRGVMAVGAVDQQGAKASYSLMGNGMALMAPGGTGGSDTMLLSTSNSGSTSPEAPIYDYKSGTSFAAPLASGVASLILAINPKLSPQALVARMRAAARPHSVGLGLPVCSVANPSSWGACNCTTSACGAGMLDAAQSVLQAYAPAALIRLQGTPSPGSDLMLDGSASAGVQGASIVRYQWSIVSGVAADVQNANTAALKLRLPTGQQQYVVKLQVTDNLGRVGEDTVSFSSNPAPESSGGGGAVAWLWLLGLWLLLGGVYVQKYNVFGRKPT
jgi:serine protease